MSNCQLRLLFWRSGSNGFYFNLNITADILIFKKYIKYFMDFVKNYIYDEPFFPNMTPCFITEPQTDTGTINTVKLH